MLAPIAGLVWTFDPGSSGGLCYGPSEIEQRFSDLPESHPRIETGSNQENCHMNRFKGAMLVVITVLAFASLANAQGGYRNTEYDKMNNGPGGPAPKRDFTGSWAGPIPADDA